jgi:hypothetical protein
VWSKTINTDFFAIDEARVYFLLDTGKFISLPLVPESDCLCTEIEPDAKSIFYSREETNSWMDEYVKNKRIAAIWFYNHHEPNVFLELETGAMLSECIVSPHGTGMAGLHCYSSPAETESRFGYNFSRLHDMPESSE